MEGLEAKWEIQNNNIIKLIQFRESNYQVADVFYHIENRGLQSTSTLVKALEIGVTTIHASLNERIYLEKSIKTQVDIQVHYPLRLKPALTLFVVLGTQINFELSIATNEKTQLITMPNSKFEWSASNKNVVSLDQNGLAKCISLGQSSVIVTNRFFF